MLPLETNGSHIWVNLARIGQNTLSNTSGHCWKMDAQPSQKKHCRNDLFDRWKVSKLGKQYLCVRSKPHFRALEMGIYFWCLRGQTDIFLLNHPFPRIIIHGAFVIWEAIQMKKELPLGGISCIRGQFLNYLYRMKCFFRSTKRLSKLIHYTHLYEMCQWSPWKSALFAFTELDGPR